jgi:hypothetical protein
VPQYNSDRIGRISLAGMHEEVPIPLLLESPGEALQPVLAHIEGWDEV